MRSKGALLLGSVLVTGIWLTYLRVASPTSHIPTFQPSVLPIMVSNGLCQAKQFGADPKMVEPDPSCTPGMADPTKTAAILCDPSYTTKSVRPPATYTTALKIKQIAQYGYTDTATQDYEEDHLISLELGGSPTDPKNLWPEFSFPNPKDSVEDLLHKKVCSGQISLQEAQKEISTDWVSVYKTNF